MHIPCQVKACTWCRPCTSKLFSVKTFETLQGEDQKKLDILANEVFLNMLANSGQCAVVVSSYMSLTVMSDSNGPWQSWNACAIQEEHYCMQ